MVIWGEPWMGTLGATFRHSSTTPRSWTIKASTPAEDDTLHTHGGAHLDAGQGVDGHLGGTVDGDMGGNLAAQLHHAQILDDESIHTAQSGMADQLGQFIHFPVRNQGV